MCQVVQGQIWKKIKQIKNWRAETRQFQISMSERTNRTGKVGLLQRGWRTWIYVAPFYQCDKILPYTRTGRNSDIF